MRKASDAAFSEYVAVRGPALLRTAYLLCGGDTHQAEELLQDALAKVYQRWDRLEHPQAADAYVRTTLTNTRRSWWRRKGRRSELSAEHLPEPTGDAVGDISEERVDMWREISKLAPGQRAPSGCQPNHLGPRCFVGDALSTHPGR